MSSKQQSTGSTENNQPMPTAHKLGMTRRDLLRRSAVGAATVGAVSTGAVRLDHGPVQNTQAIAPAVVAGAKLGAAGASVGVGWALRDLDPLNLDGAPSGLTGPALHNEFFNAAGTRASTNASSIVDNENIIEGIDHSAHADGKIAAIDALNEQESQDDVEDSAHEGANEYETTVIRNLFKTWNESVEQLESFNESVEDHDDIGVSDVYDFSFSTSNMTADGINHLEFPTETVELPDGSDFDLKEIVVNVDANDNQDSEWSPLRSDYETDTNNNYAKVNPKAIAVANPGDGDRLLYLNHNDWNDVYNEIRDLFDDVRSGLSVWVDGVYGDVQSGELDTDELLTPREQAELTSEDEDFPQAVADLQALNVAVDTEREAEIYLPQISATIYGQLGYGGDGTLETGEIDPDDKDSSIYLTYDVSQGQGTWDAYEDGIDGGEITFTSEPFADTIYYVDTAAGETAELTADDFEENDDEEWTTDVSDDLDDAITEIDQVEFYAKTEETQYETIQLRDQFEIIQYTDSDGNEYEETSFERSEPQSDDNYISEKEWKEQQERHEELIEQYEDSQGGGISIPGVDDVLDGEANGLIGIAVVGFVLVSAILSALNPLS